MIKYAKHLACFKPLLLVLFMFSTIAAQCQVVEGNVLPNVTVSTQTEKKAGKIMKRVQQNMEKNYSHPAFDQKFTIEELVRNYDTTKSKITYSLKQHLDEGQVTMYNSGLDLHSDTANYNASFFNFIGIPDLSLWWVINGFDFVRKDVVTGKKGNDYFNFKLLGYYRDDSYGPVYRISFKPRSKDYKVFESIKQLNMRPAWWGHFSGEMLVSENDYAIVNIQYAQDIAAEIKKAAIERLYHSPGWKADKVSKIIPYSESFNDEYSYAKDVTTGKYFIRTIKFNCYQTGYQVENNQPVQLYYQVNINSPGVENVRLAAK